MTSKPPEEIRRTVRQYLNQLSSIERRSLADQALENFIRTPEFRRCRHIGLFFPVRHELDILPLIDICQSRNKRIYFPCLYPMPFQKLYFLPYNSKDTFSINRFSIPEPDLPIRKRISLFRLDLVVTPLLAFGEHGERLGMGGGFYDRTFAYRLKPGLLKRPRLWSIALQAQHYPLTSNPWDIPVDGVSTEKGNTRYDHSLGYHHHP